jgi:branched-chain amino acid transport system permease protein
MTDWIGIIIQGSLLGGLYALFAIGLSITYGVMRIVNIAHGDFIVLSSYLALVPISMLGVHPFVVILPVAVFMFGLGYLLQRVLLNRTIGPDILPPLLVTFGLSIMIQNGLLEVFTADSKAIQLGELSTASLELGGGISIGVFPLIVFAVSLLLTVGLNLLFNRTSVGMALRATSDDPATASLMGIRSKHVYAMAMGLSFALVAVGGVLSDIRTTFTPSAGPASLLYAFEAVVIGGLGSLWGTFAGALILGIAQAIGAEINAGYGVLFGHLVFLLVLVFKPTGLFARTR